MSRGREPRRVPRGPLPAWLLLALAVAAATPVPGSAQGTPPIADDPGPQLSVALSPEQVTVGDRISAVFTVTQPAAADAPRFPEWGERWGEAEVFAVHGPERISDREGVAVWRQRVEIAAFRPGEVQLPPVTVEAQGPDGAEALSSADLALVVRSVLPAETAGEGVDPQTLEPRPPSPPQRLPLGSRFWWTTAGIAALALAALLLAWRRRRQARPAPVPALPPLVELERLLAALSKTGAPVSGHLRLSSGLRRYLGRELGFPAPESTTTEIQRRLTGRRLPDGVDRQLVSVLKACDLVKFARAETDGPALAERSATVHTAAQRLDAYLHPPEADPARDQAAP